MRAACSAAQEAEKTVVTTDQSSVGLLVEYLAGCLAAKKGDLTAASMVALMVEYLAVMLAAKMAAQKVAKTAAWSVA